MILTALVTFKRLYFVTVQTRIIPDTISAVAECGALVVLGRDQARPSSLGQVQAAAPVHRGPRLGAAAAAASHFSGHSQCAVQCRDKISQSVNTTNKRVTTQPRSDQALPDAEDCDRDEGQLPVTGEWSAPSMWWRVTASVVV